MFADFVRTTAELAPRTAVVLGSGLGAAAAAFRERRGIGFAEVPGLVPTTVTGHAGRLAVGHWDGVAVVLFRGRLHAYEGHAAGLVAGPVRLAAELGIARLILTNAAGGIRPDLTPGSLLALNGHLNLFGRDAWKRLAHGVPPAAPYSPRLLGLLADLPTGVYAGLTGPSYETPAEIRALARCGADAVGMSTVLEAEAAAARRLEVCAISCITNTAAGIGGATPAHSEVLATAARAVDRLGAVIARLLRDAGP